VGEITPLARTDHLLTEEVDGELIVLDPESNVACRLNRTAALVWEHSDGTRTVTELAAVLAQEIGGVVDDDLVLMALDDLVEHDLLLSGYEKRDGVAVRLSRRRFFRRAGIASGAAMAAPVVYSMVAPSAAAAAVQSGPYGPYGPYASDRRLKRNIQTLRGRR
jgi:hypothetical protein